MSPLWNPGHCPPAVLWLMNLDHERIESIRLYHPATGRGSERV
jgi:hypothetical protein